jgi:hypothetical protein
MADLSIYNVDDVNAPWNKGDYLKINDPLQRKQMWSLSDQGLQNTPSTTTKPFDPTRSNAALSNRWIAMGKNAQEQDILNQLASQPEQQDPYLTALYSLMGKNTADTSGYDAALGTIANQRKSSAKRYQTYSAQISDLFGNLGRKSDTFAQEQAGIGQQSAITRSQLAAQQASQAEQTRTADAARLKAATEARSALGLGEAASAGAAGDIATLRGEQALTDQQAVGQTTIDTILANEALAKLMSSRQAGGFDLAGQQAQQQLNMSYEDMLNSLANAEAQTKIQKSQAISAGAMSPSEQIAILQAAKNYTDAQANSGTGTDPATVWMTANPNSAGNAQALLSSFVPWFTSAAPSVDTSTGKTPTLSQMVNAYSKAHPEGANIIAQDPTLYNLIQVYTGLK